MLRGDRRVRPLLALAAFAAGLAPAHAQGSAPNAAPLFGPAQLGGAVTYRVTETNEFPDGPQTRTLTLDVRWKVASVLTVTLSDPAKTNDEPEQYLVPRGPNGALDLAAVTPADAGLRQLCEPLEAIADLRAIDAASALPSLDGKVPALTLPPTVPPAPRRRGAPSPPATGCATVTTAPKPIPVVASRLSDADGSAALVASGSVTGNGRPAPHAAVGFPNGGGGFPDGGGGFPDGGGGFPGRGRHGGRGPQASATPLPPGTEAVRLSAHLAADGALTALQLTRSGSDEVEEGALLSTIAVERATPDGAPPR